MKKRILGTGIILVGVLALSLGATSALAHGTQTVSNSASTIQADHCMAGGDIGNWGMMGGNLGGFMGTETLESIASTLRLTVEQLETYLADGITLAEIAEDADVDISEITDIVLVAHNEMVEFAIENGHMSEEDIEYMQEQAQSMVEDIITGNFDENHGHNHGADEDHHYGNNWSDRSGAMNYGMTGGGMMGGSW